MSTTELKHTEASKKQDPHGRPGTDPVQAAALAQLEALEPPAHLADPDLAPNALAVLAIAERGGLLNAPDMYMNKIAIGPGGFGAQVVGKSLQITRGTAFAASIVEGTGRVTGTALASASWSMAVCSPRCRWPPRA